MKNWFNGTTQHSCSFAGADIGLTYHRGGCIICIDYGYWADENYLKLWRNFDIITEVLYKEILSLIHKGLNPRQSFLFGFSYGGHIVSTIGRRLPSKYKFKKIDICDMAGPGFDFFTDHNHKDAADNVQCYYSSIGKGSRFYNCHQNIRLGQCGYTQPASLTQSLYSSHGLCVQIYINAFDHPFYALQNPPRWCATANPAQNLPKYFTIGYKESGYRHIHGDIFVPTGLQYPYNLSKRQLARFQALHGY
uniref:Lipase domain-containing protein n=1 Tax=Glossina pallidipes TaxID=7398 RepID=A0A1A9ZRD2_GLOPL